MCRIPEWYGRLPDGIDMSLDPEIKLLSLIIDEAFNAMDDDMMLAQRLKIIIDAADKSMKGKQLRTTQFTVERLSAFIHKLSMAMRMHIKDPQLIREISNSMAMLLKEDGIQVPALTVHNE